LILARRSFSDLVARTGSLPRLKRIMPCYVAAVIAAFRGLARLGPLSSGFQDAADSVLIANVAICR
jgi:hypothetical protein